MCPRKFRSAQNLSGFISKFAGRICKLKRNDQPRCVFTEVKIIANDTIYSKISRGKSGQADDQLSSLELCDDAKINAGKSTRHLGTKMK